MLIRITCVLISLNLFFHIPVAVARMVPAEEIASVFESCGLKGKLNEAAFASAYRKACNSGIYNGRIVIIDFSLPSSAQRMFIVDLGTQKLLYSALVAHGKGSGELKADKFSNIPESHQSSTGLFKIGEKIISPKHGDALLLEGLDRGINDNARKREIIIHGADYVSEEFIRMHGRIGRSYGCPAVSRKDIGTVINLLRKGDLLFIYAGSAS